MLIFVIFVSFVASLFVAYVFVADAVAFFVAAPIAHGRERAHA